ncbi:hypothetical protein HY734_01775 [Candidatus Uhrbacteria bacterium]|nr:hypothetical protein [Candidatus Uhrbacteria bacterium]
MRNTVLILPPNDPEAVMILKLASALQIPVLVCDQPHGASLDHESDILKRVREGDWQRAAIVEMPGPKTEARLRRAGMEVVLIDHHNYGKLDRAHNAKTGKLLSSSLEQFHKLFRVTDDKLKRLGFDPVLVRGIGIMDRGFVWALREEGYSEKDVKRVLAYQKELMAVFVDPKEEARKDATAEKAWNGRKVWKGFTVISHQSKDGLRGRLSRIIAVEVKHPIPLILSEPKRGTVYVQESPHAPALIRHFGGFTFGMDRNWGYKNEGNKPRVMLMDVKKFLGQDKIILSL